MPDFITNITAKDNSSATINKIKDGFKSIAESNKDLEKIKTTFDNIVNSTKPVKTQLRELQQLMVSMNVKGLTNTDVFTEVAQKAGELKDAMSDARQAVSAYANDTFKIQASVEAFQGVTAAISLSTSAMALFGKQNKDVERALLKVQAAMGMMNSIQQIANLLNKDSAVMLRLKQIRLDIAAASQKKLAAATTVATTAEVANNTVTKTGTVVQTAWNTAKAIAKALMGDFTGLLLVGVGVMAAYAAATADSSDELDEMTKSTENVTEKTKDFRQVAQDTYARLMTSYSQLKAEWQQLSTEHAKNKWIKDNASKLDELELSITDVNSAEAVFNGNTDAVVQAFVERAKAAARLAELTEEYRKQMKLIDEINDISVSIKADAERSGRKASAGQEITDQTYRNSRYGNVNAQGKWVFHAQGAKLYSGSDTSSNPQIQQKENELKASQDRTNKIVQDIAKNTKVVPKLAGRSTQKDSNKTDKKTDKKDNTPDYKTGSINEMSAEVSKLEKKLKDGVVPESDIQKTIDRIKFLKDTIEKEEIRLGLKVDPKEREIEEAKKKIKEQLKKLGKEEVEIEYTPKQSSYQKAVGSPEGPKTYEDQLGGIESQMDFNDRLLDQLKAIAEAYAALGEAGAEGYARVNEKIQEVADSQAKLGEQAKETNKANEKLKKQEKTLNEIGDAASMTGGMLKQMGEAAGSEGLQVAGIIAEAIANIVLGYAKASAQAGAGAAGGPWGWVAFAIAGLATVAATISQIHSLSGYAEGGIIGGKTTIGDYNLARVNKGEMILNTRQQENLFNLIDSGRVNNQSGGGEVVFRIKGKNLEGVRRNYNDKMKKLR